METRNVAGARRRVVIYCRISDDREGRGWGVDRQERACRKRADENGWDVIAVFAENDVSAFSGQNRPKYQAMLAMLRDGEADAVLSLSGKRLQRNFRDAFDFLDLIEQRNVVVETIKAGLINLNTAEGRGRARRAAIDAQEESEEISERVRDAKADNVAAGTYRGGPRPFGYESDGTTLRTLECPACPGAEGFTVDRTCEVCGADAVNAEKSEAWYIEQATLATVDGESLRSVCRTWAAEGVRTVPRRYRQADGTKGEPTSKEWQPAELRKLLLRARNAGLMEITVIGPDEKEKMEVTGKASWPAVTSEDNWRACKATLENPARKTTVGNGRVWLLSGLARCWCGSTVRGGSKGVGQARETPDGRRSLPAYRCNANPSDVVRDSVQVDAFIESMTVARLSRPDAAELHLKVVASTRPSEDLPRQAANLRVKLDSIAADYGQDLITRQQMIDLTATTRQRLNEVNAKMAGRAATSVLASLPLGDGDAMEELWPTLHLDRRRQIVDAVMEITINKARRGRPKGYRPGIDKSYFDPETIDIAWKPPA